jgi:GntR family transcriptional regulator/MocR family aminotransferase
MARSCDYKQISAGSILLAHLLLQQGQYVYMGGPRLPGCAKRVEQAGATVVAVSVDDEGIRLPQDNAEDESLIYVTPSHQFPLGVCMSLARWLSLLQAARVSHSWIVEDDYDAEFRYTSSPQPSLQSLNEHR